VSNPEPLLPSAPLIGAHKQGNVKGKRATLVARLGVLTALLFAEKSVLNLLVDFRLADAARGWGFALRQAQHFGLRFAVAFAVALAVFIYVRGDARLRKINREVSTIGFQPRWLAIHLLLLAGVALSLYNLYGNHGIRLPIALLGSTALGMMTLATAALLLVLAPASMWWRATCAVGVRWAYAALAALIGTVAIVWSQDLWGPTAQLTFGLVHELLRPVLPSLQADAATRILRTPNFAVQVSRVCSGLEGTGMMLAFCSAWLLYFRAEYRFPRALLVIPAGIVLVFALNVVRIAVLVLIGNAGHPAMAVYGFHSQAGWIAFNCTACGVAFASRRTRWLQRDSCLRAETPTSDSTAAYLVPFLAVLAAGMLSRALSSGFETWYALRLLVGLAAFIYCWPRLAKLDWRFGWCAIAVGAATFLIWLLASHWLLVPHGMPQALSAMPTGSRISWILTRACTAVVMVPTVEELAYRGYLLRRVVAEDFEKVPFSSVGWPTLLITSVVFGALHGALWLPGTIAGLAYGSLLIRSGRIGDAVLAHSTTNLLIVVWVLGFGQWQLW